MYFLGVGVGVVLHNIRYPIDSPILPFLKISELLLTYCSNQRETIIGDHYSGQYDCDRFGDDMQVG